MDRVPHRAMGGVHCGGQVVYRGTRTGQQSGVGTGGGWVFVKMGQLAPYGNGILQLHSHLWGIKIMRGCCIAVLQGHSISRKFGNKEILRIIWQALETNHRYLVVLQYLNQ